MELVLIYLWLKIDSIITLFGVIIVLSLIAFVAFSIYIFDGECTEDKDADALASSIKRRRSSFVVASIALAVWVFVPSAKDIAILVGASYALDMAKSPEGQKVQSLLRAKANEMIDAELSKAKGEKK